MDTEGLIRDYLEGPHDLRRAVAGLSSEQLRARPIPGRWSVLEVVCHLADSEQAWCHRMKRTIAEDRPLLIGYDETRFAASLAYHDHDVEEDLALFELLREQMARVLRLVPAAAWARPAIHSQYGLMTLEDQVRTEVEHVSHHLKHIEEKRQALGVTTS